MGARMHFYIDWENFLKFRAGEEAYGWVKGSAPMLAKYHIDVDEWDVVETSSFGRVTIQKFNGRG